MKRLWFPWTLLLALLLWSVPIYAQVTPEFDCTWSDNGCDYGVLTDPDGTGHAFIRCEGTDWIYYGDGSIGDEYDCPVM
jgi:hypothetical protein